MTGERHTTVENLAALYAILWGFFIANPLIDSFAKNPRLYAPMLQLMPSEAAWGLIFSFSGVIALLYAYTNRRRHAAFVMGITFTAFSVLLLIGDIQSPGWVFFGLIAVFNFIHWRYMRWKSAKVSNG